MNDLEKLLRDKQDALRGRPEDWIDRFVAWYNVQNWEDNFIAAILLFSVSVSLGTFLIIAWLLVFGG